MTTREKTKSLELYSEYSEYSETQKSENQKVRPVAVIGAVLNHLNNRFDSVHQHIQETRNDILQKLQEKKHKKVQPTRLLERDAVSLEFYDLIMKIERKQRQRYISYSRFRVAITLLFFTGARVNEISNLTRAQVDKLLKDKILIINQSKTKSQRKVILGQKAINHLNALKKDIDMVFMKNENLSGNKSKIDWILKSNIQGLKNIIFSKIVNY